MILRRAIKTASVFVLVIGLIAGVVSIQNTISFKGRASGVPANIVVDLSSSFPNTNNSWEFLAQGGEERGRSLASVIPQVKNLKPRYIRIDHMYDFFSVVSKEGGVLRYNWTELDAYLRDITATGGKPFLSLSYTPQALGDKDVAMPDLSLWRTLVKATIEHVSGRNGLAISDVYYEVWNEPDLFGQYKVYPPKDYRELYKASSDGAVVAQNTLPFHFGGPGTTALYKNWFDALVTLSRDPQVRFDFFSWHQYGEDTGVLSQNIADVTRWKAEAQKPDLELFVTENGMNAANDPGYDSNASALHALSAASISADKVTGLTSFEIKDGPGPSQFWGRWGLLTHEKFGTPVAKPRYKALEFLKGMSFGNRLNVAGNGSFVTAFARSNGQVSKLFVVNYDPNGKHVEAVPIRLTGIPYQKFLFVRQDFQGSRVQVLVFPTNGQWSTVQYFKANSAAIFELIPQQ